MGDHLLKFGSQDLKMRRAGFPSWRIMFDPVDLIDRCIHAPQVKGAAQALSMSAKLHHLGLRFIHLTAEKTVPAVERVSVAASPVQSTIDADAMPAVWDKLQGRERIRQNFVEQFNHLVEEYGKQGKELDFLAPDQRESAYTMSVLRLIHSVMREARGFGLDPKALLKGLQINGEARTRD